MNIVEEILIKNSLITAFVFVGVTVYLSYFLSEKLTKGRFHGSAIAIIPVSYTHLRAHET